MGEIYRAARTRPRDNDQEAMPPLSGHWFGRAACFGSSVMMPAALLADKGAVGRAAAASARRARVAGGAVALLLSVCVACAPQGVDRVQVLPNDAGGVADGTDSGVSPGAGGVAGTGAGGMAMDAAGGAGGTGGVAADARDAVVDLGPDPADSNRDGTMTMVDVAIDMAPRPDVAADMPRNRMAYVVIADPAMLNASDMRLRTLLEAKGFTVRHGDDEAPAGDVNGAGLLVVSGTSDSLKVMTKYLNTPIPALILEQAAYDDMQMGGPVAMTDWGAVQATQIAMTSTHPLAAGLSGTVTVLSMPAGLGWAKPAPTAIKIATVVNVPDQVAMFAYEAGAIMMTNTPAPARRVGMFPGEGNAPLLAGDGVKLLNAALDWLMM